MTASSSNDVVKCVHCDKLLENGDNRFYVTHGYNPSAYSCESCFKQKEYKFQCDACKVYCKSTLTCTQLVELTICHNCCCKAAKKFPHSTQKRYDFERMDGYFEFIAKSTSKYKWEEIVECMLDIFSYCVGRDVVQKHLSEWHAKQEQAENVC